MKRIARALRYRQRDASHSSEHARSSGQALVEFALVFPVLLLLMLSIVDFSRVFTALITVESAAREAADFGAFNRTNWAGENYDNTLAAMDQRWCVASSGLTDFEPADPVVDKTLCSNPRLVSDPVLIKTGATGKDCAAADRDQPCLVRVELEYDFHLIAPVGFDVLGTRIGFPDTITFRRASTFAVGDFQLDEPTGS